MRVYILRQYNREHHNQKKQFWSWFPRYQGMVHGCSGIGRQESSFLLVDYGSCGKGYCTCGRCKKEDVKICRTRFIASQKLFKKLCLYSLSVSGSLTVTSVIHAQSIILSMDVIFMSNDVKCLRNVNEII